MARLLWNFRKGGKRSYSTTPCVVDNTGTPNISFQCESFNFSLFSFWVRWFFSRGWAFVSIAFVSFKRKWNFWMRLKGKIAVTQVHWFNFKYPYKLYEPKKKLEMQHVSFRSQSFSWFEIIFNSTQILPHYLGHCLMNVSELYFFSFFFFF